MSSEVSSNSRSVSASGNERNPPYGIRQASAMGRFYAASTEQLLGSVTDLLAETGSRGVNREDIVGLLVPHAGYVFSGRVAACAYGLLDSTCNAYDRIALLGSSHWPSFNGISVGLYDAFSTPLGNVPVDVSCCEELRQQDALFVGPRQAHDGEHTLEVQLPFLQCVFDGLPIVPLLCSALDREQVEQAAAILSDRMGMERTLWVVSSDFTHHGEDFGYVPFAKDVFARIRELDDGAMGYIEALDWRGFLDCITETGATICGATAIALFLATLEAADVKTACRRLAHELSGEMLHDEGHSVSYVSAAFFAESSGAETPATEGIPMVSQEDGGALIDLARQAISDALHGVTEPSAAQNTEDDLLKSQHACFVTLYVDGFLRGCMGGVDANRPLSAAVQEHARQAAFMDSRFHPLSAAELPKCRIEVTILSPCRNINGPQDIRIGTHGVALQKGQSRAVFLPDVLQEHDWTGLEALQRLSLKAGLPAHGWRRANLSVFNAVTVSE